MLDQTVAGGLTHGLDPRTCVVKECGEEASIPEELVTAPGRLTATGAITYVATAEGGWIQPGELSVIPFAFESEGRGKTDLVSTRLSFRPLFVAHARGPVLLRPQAAPA